MHVSLGILIAQKQNRILVTNKKERNAMDLYCTTAKNAHVISFVRVLSLSLTGVAKYGRRETPCALPSTGLNTNARITGNEWSK